MQFKLVKTLERGSYTFHAGFVTQEWFFKMQIFSFGKKFDHASDPTFFLRETRNRLQREAAGFPKNYRLRFGQAKVEKGMESKTQSKQCCNLMKKKIIL